MKLRVRSTATKEAIRVEVSDTSSILDLKALIASKVSSSSTSVVSPESIHLSLNRTDEIISASLEEPLHAYGLTSGDLLYYSLDSAFSSAPVTSLSQSATFETLKNPLSSASAEGESIDSNPASSEPPSRDMEFDSEPFVLEQSAFAPCFLRKVMEAEKGKIKGNLGLTVVTLHAIFLESGFVLSSGDGGGSSLPEEYTTASHVVSVSYTLPEFIGCGTVENIQPVVLRFSAVGNHVSVYGCLVGVQSEVYRLCLDSSKLSPLLSSSTNELSGREEGEIFQLWKIVKDGLCMPLLIDFCIKNGLPLPPCFSRLPTDIKIKILELLSGIDLAKAACASSELRYLASNDDIWRWRFLDEFGVPDERNVGEAWKAKFARFWIRKKALTSPDNALLPYIRTPRVFRMPWVPGPQRFPMVGGDYDRFPVIGDHCSSQRARFPRLHLARQNFWPQCNFGGGSFM